MRPGRSTTEPAPSAPEIFKDWLRLPGNDKIRKINFAITFAHAARIGAELYYSGTEEVGYQQMAKATILGSMPQPEVFYKEAAGFHNGGTLTFKELYPVVKAVNLLLSRDPNDLSTDS